MASKDNEIWEDYTLLDFLKILKIDSSSEHAKKEYYKFVGTINRFNRLLDRMYCEECKEILYPIQESNYAHYRVVRFHCENKECSKSDKTKKENQIYLHHCLNGKCNAIIDSRKSKKCPNGLYICSNEKCGCCCSHEMMNRRLKNLQATGGFIHENLKNAVINKLGHLERAEHFCYKCGKQMDELRDDIFQCPTCSTLIDVSENKFNRPHKYLKKKQENQPTNRPSNDIDYEDEYPF